MNIDREIIKRWYAGCSIKMTATDLGVPIRKVREVLKAAFSSKERYKAGRTRIKR